MDQIRGERRFPHSLSHPTPPIILAHVSPTDSSLHRRPSAHPNFLRCYQVLIYHARLENKAKLKPYELVDPSHTDLRNMLRDAASSYTEKKTQVNGESLDAQYIKQNQGDFIDADDPEEGPVGSGSDTD